MSSFVRNSSLSLLTVGIWSLHTTFIELSKRNGSYDYDFTGVIVITELSKMVLSLILYYRNATSVHSGEGGANSSAALTTGMTVNQATDALFEFATTGGNRFAIPAVVYAIYNNLTFMILTAFNPTSWRVLINIRILWTALLFQYFFNKKLSRRKWTALVLLMVGCMNMSSGKMQWDGMAELSLIIIQTLVSAFGLVYNEYLVKSNSKQEVHIQNIYLYGFGVCFNLLFMMILNPGNAKPSVFFRNWNWQLIPVTAVSAFGGVVISLVLKHMDSVWKLFLDVGQLLCVYVIGLTILGDVFEPSQLIWVCVVSAASLLFQMEDKESSDDKSSSSSSMDPSKGVDGDEHAHDVPLLANSSSTTSSPKQSV